MKSRVTIALDGALLDEVRALAIERGMSISDMLTASLEQIVSERKSYGRASKRALARPRARMKLGWKPPLSRDQLHDR